MSQAGDELARQAALDPSRSFIVQAPAGSGKTELLIQRYLTLLMHVHEPEQIVAITFTRKAAAEMRGRILAALRAAEAGTTATTAHGARTYELACDVLKRDEARAWDVLAQPQRLRIDTLDAVNAWLARQLPLLSGGVAAARIEDDAGEQYRQAASRTLDRLSSRGSIGLDTRRLLRLLDNSVPRLETLLAGLLPKRDQWLGHLAGRDEASLRASLEQGLKRLVDEHLATLEGLWPEGVLGAINELLAHAAEYSPDEKVVEARAAWLEQARVPAAQPSRLVFWRGVARLLLTDGGAWRRRLTRTQGFMPEHREAKQRFAATVGALDDTLRESLGQVPELPEPHYADAEWLDLVALRRVLLQLVAELRVIFATQAAADFVELALAAQRALGRVDRPSELLLALDRRIQHILIDEFQDTSKTQLRLLEMLTSGWQHDDGRSLFLVGDPMQSIYRFRDADMSLFLQVRQHGIGDVRCEPLELKANFRSAPSLVAWVNRAFAAVFPAQDQLESGQARFYASVPSRQGSPEQGVQLHLLRSVADQVEVERVIEVIEQELARGQPLSLGILVQSRTHLLGLHERLKARGWPVHAVEIDAVTERQLGQDLLGLTRSLSHLGDRIAWLGLLRAPWCGLTWRDLERLSGADHERTIWELMNDPQRVAQLSPDGRARLTAVREVLTLCLRSSGLYSFARWVEWCWRALDGPACLEQPEDLQTADQFFARLAELTRHGGPVDPATLEAAFARPQVQGEPGRDAAIEIMTIHRAKGLEFDTVVLYGLARAPRRDAERALYWLERTQGPGHSDLLLAPLQREQSGLTKLLRRHEDARDLSERARVLYVATTRARERLHLICCLEPESNSVAKRSLLSCLWPALGEEFQAAQIDVPAPCEPLVTLEPRLRRLDAMLDPAVARRSLQVRAERAWVGEALQFEWAGQTAVRVGTLVHDELLQIARSGLPQWSDERITKRMPWYRRKLTLLGVDQGELEPATRRVVDALHAVLRDATGRWILSDHHEAASELRLTLLSPEGLRHAQLDRTFVDDAGVRWIIDYKTSSHEGGQLEAFLDSEMSRYREQVERYAAAMAAIDPRPQRVALYFPLLGALRDWTPAA